VTRDPREDKERRETVLRTETDIIVRSTEIDVNGHVNNAKYLEYLEWGREDWYERMGFPYDRFLEMGYQTVTVNININYRRECRQGDRLTIVTSPLRAGRSSFALRQEIFNQRGELCTEADVVIVTMDARTRKAREMPEELKKGLNGESGRP
jgi:thioesterase-3